MRLPFSLNKWAFIYLDVISINEEAVSRNDTSRFKDDDITNDNLIDADGLSNSFLATDDSDLALLMPFLQLNELFVLYVVIDSTESDQNS